MSSGITTMVTDAQVALRKESVDRNVNEGDVNRVIHGRSPQGERG